MIARGKSPVAQQLREMAIGDTLEIHPEAVQTVRRELRQHRIGHFVLIPPIPNSLAQIHRVSQEELERIKNDEIAERRRVETHRRRSEAQKREQARRRQDRADKAERDAAALARLGIKRPPKRPRRRRDVSVTP